MSDLPIELRNLIQQLLATLPETHTLDAAQRQAIYIAMGSWERGGIGHRRRARLAICSAKRVLHLVECLVPGSLSRALILLAEQILEGKQDTMHASLLLMLHWREWLEEDPQAVREMLLLYSRLGNRGAEETLETVDQVAHAAKQALEVTLWDEPDVSVYLKHYPDTTLEYWMSFDAASWAWLAERAKGSPTASLQNGDAFWIFWLREAVPRAWASEVE